MPEHQETAGHTVKIVIPIYKSSLNRLEAMSLDNTMRVFSARKVAFLKPRGLDITPITTAYPRAETVSVSDDWLGTKRGIAGYNEMMLSETFYDLFADTDYILICHTDAWVFRDSLSDWCDGTYDVVAAPWPTYRHFPLRQYYWLKKLYLPVYQRITPPEKHLPRFIRMGKVGNGGLSLRRVSALKWACRQYAKEAERFIRYHHNEDLFWALVPKGLSLPDERTALRFAFDIKPKMCYRLNHRQLPMGCHGFTHKSRMKFWKDFIPV